MVRPSLVIITLGLSASVLAGTPIAENSPAVCSNDRCQRVFEAARHPERRPEASAYCSAFLNTVIDPVTVTGTATVFETQTIAGEPSYVTDPPATYTVTVTPDPVTVTNAGSTYIDREDQPEVTITAPAYLTTVIENVKATVTSIGFAPVVIRRDDTPRNARNYPAFLDGPCDDKNGVAKADRVSSACSCLLAESRTTLTVQPTQEATVSPASTTYEVEATPSTVPVILDPATQTVQPDPVTVTVTNDALTETVFPTIVNTATVTDATVTVYVPPPTVTPTCVVQPSCTASRPKGTLLRNPPATAVCAKRGKAHGDVFVTSNIPNQNFESCARLCLKMKNGGCNAIEYRTNRSGTTFCRLMDTCVACSEVTMPGSASYYDRSCFDCTERGRHVTLHPTAQ